MKSDEVWKDIKDHEGLYQISNYGRVKKILKRNNIIIKETLVSVRKRNYYLVNISNGKDTIAYVHKLVAEAFIPNPHNNKYVRFIDGDKYNIYYKNLEWSKKYNLNKNKMIRCIETNEVFLSPTDAADKLMLNIGSICNNLSGRRKRVSRTINGIKEYFSFKYINS